MGHSEIDHFADSIYRFHFSNPNYGDITTIDPKTVPDFDLLTGGFPCQAFSCIGKHQGFSDRNGAVFFDLARLIAAKKPRYLLLENVKGLLSHEHGETFRVILQTLDELGYFLEWQVCNSVDFGVPQHRERVFLVGHLGAVPGHKVFPLAGAGAGACAGIHNRTKTEGKETSNVIIPVRTPGKRKLRPGNRRFKEAGAPFYTLLTNERHGIFDGKSIRRLTPLEYERLQGFPDHWTRYGKKDDGSVVEMSETRRYHCLGNALTVNIVAAIAGKWFEQVGDSRMIYKRKSVKNISS